jgi:hypothetical protein
MKTRLYSALLVLSLLFWVQDSSAGELPEALQRVLRADTSYQSITCRIEIELDVPGLSMPEKEIELKLEKGQEPQITGIGVVILPRHGIIGQYHEFLEADSQVIPMGEEGDTIYYKVVSLDKKTDWVTVDMTVVRSEARIYAMLISTRKNGEYLVRNSYGPESDFFPEQTEISFEAMPLKLPLKFLGNQEGVELLSDKNEPVTGKVLLRYTDIYWRKSLH